MSSSSYLYYGQLANNSISYLNLSIPISDKAKEIHETLLVQNEIDLQWPDTFGFDNKGFMYAVTNRLQKFFANKYDVQDVNLRVIRTWLGLKSYMYSAKEPVVALSVEQANKQTTTVAPSTTTGNSTATANEEAGKEEPADHDHDHSEHGVPVVAGNETRYEHDNNTISSTISSNNGNQPETLPKTDESSNEDNKSNSVNVLAPITSLLIFTFTLSRILYP